jgi:adenylate kinase
MEKLYVVCGQSGVGKSTVIQKAAEGMEDLTVVNFGEQILKLALDGGFVKEGEEVTLLRPECLSELQVRATERVKNLKGRVILDMHLTVRTPSGFIAGMPKRVMDVLEPRRIILLEADAYEILKRRMVGKDRKNVDESLKDIQEHSDFDRAAAISIAMDIGTPIMILKNDDVEKTALQLRDILEEQ